MKKLLEKLGTSAEHLRLIDDFFLNFDPEYASIDSKLESTQGFDELCNQLYYGQDGRQMILSDLLQHVIAIRGYYFFFQNKQAYLKILFYIVNQLMLQENIIFQINASDQPERKKLLNFLEENSNELTGFFDGDDLRWHEKYENCKTAPNEEVDNARKPLYRVIDSVLPKSLGNAVELLVFAYLLSNEVGLVWPLLEIQQHLKTSREDVKVVPPDFLLVKGRNTFGVEVGAGPSGRGKIGQSNVFMGKTSLPVLTVNVNPPGVNASFRCPKCQKWILYCDRIIEGYSNRNIREINDEEIDCWTCPEFENCNKAVYYGREIVRGDVSHYHYKCVRDLDYVRRAVGRYPSKVSPLYLVVEGLEALED